MIDHGRQFQIKFLSVILLIAMVTVALVLPRAAFAQSKSSKSQNKKTQSINFEDELIEGAGKKPDLFWLQSKKKFNFRKLIKLRDDFLPEMERTAEDLKRAGSAD